MGVCRGLSYFVGFQISHLRVIFDYCHICLLSGECCLTRGDHLDDHHAGNWAIFLRRRALCSGVWLLWSCMGHGSCRVITSFQKCSTSYRPLRTGSVCSWMCFWPCCRLPGELKPRLNRLAVFTSARLLVSAYFSDDQVDTLSASEVTLHSCTSGDELASQILAERVVTSTIIKSYRCVVCDAALYSIFHWRSDEAAPFAPPIWPPVVVDVLDVNRTPRDTGICPALPRLALSMLAAVSKGESSSVKRSVEFSIVCPCTAGDVFRLGLHRLNTFDEHQQISPCVEGLHAKVEESWEHLQCL